MSVWSETVRLGDVWKNEALSFEEQRDEITKRLKATRWYRSDCGEVADVVDDIQNATTVSRFDIAWGRPVRPRRRGPRLDRHLLGAPMTRRRLHTRARGNRRYVPRHAAWSRFRSVDAHVAAALGGAW